jgi:excisionase family DNA binding protein
MKEEQAIMTVQDVMDFLQLSRATVYRLVDQGAFPSYKIGRGLRFKREDIEEYFEQQKKSIE